MLRTPFAIPHLSPKPAGRAAVKAPPQPSTDQAGTFASLLGGAKPVKVGSDPKKSGSGAASSSAKSHDDDAALSQSASDDPAKSSAASDALIAGQPNQVQFSPGGALTISLASYMPLSGAQNDVSVTGSSPSANSSLATQSSRSLPHHSRAGTTATAAQDTPRGKGGVRSYAASGDNQAPAGDREIAPAADASPAVDATDTGSGMPPAFNPAAAVNMAAKSPETAPALKSARATNRTAKGSETQSLPNLLPAANTASQSAKIARASNADAEDGTTSNIAMTPSPAGSVKAPSPAVVVSSKTHFVPEAPHPAVTAGNGVATQIATGNLRQDQAEAAGQVASPSSQNQFVSELSTPVAAAGNDILPKIAAPALAPKEPETLQAQPQTKAARQAAQPN